jgi:hypothetical protein
MKNMAISAETKMEVAMKLRLSKAVKDKLDQRASESGSDVEALASELLEQAVIQPELYAALDREEYVKSLEMLEQSFRDIQEGRTQLAKQAIDEIAAEFGLTLERRPAT